MYSSHNSIWQLSFSLHFDSKYIYRQLPEIHITVGHLLSVTLEIQITLVIAIMIMTSHVIDASCSLMWSMKSSLF